MVIINQNEDNSYMSANYCRADAYRLYNTNIRNMCWNAGEDPSDLLSKVIRYPYPVSCTRKVVCDLNRFNHANLFILEDKFYKIEVYREIKNKQLKYFLILDQCVLKFNILQYDQDYLTYEPAHIYNFNIFDDVPFVFNWLIIT